LIEGENIPNDEKEFLDQFKGSSEFTNAWRTFSGKYRIGDIITGISYGLLPAWLTALLSRPRAAASC
jgi:hypothetical protein